MDDDLSVRGPPRSLLHCRVGSTRSVVVATIVVITDDDGDKRNVVPVRSSSSSGGTVVNIVFLSRASS